VRTSCEQARERLSLQLDNELSGHEALLLEGHLAGCVACTVFASDVRAHTELLRTAPLEPAPQFLLLRRPAATRVAARVAAVTAAAAAAVLVAVSTVSWPGNTGRPSATFDFWPTGLAVDQHTDGNLGVRHVALSRVQVPAAAPAGTRRGVVTST
jgi:predicted anti-sigma-YlaC factor YlaD